MSSSSAKGDPPTESLAAETSEACTLIDPKPKHRRTNSKQQLFAENTAFLKHKRRYCRIEGCNSIVKSQGLCQRHGAKPKTCKVEGCTKQAQGNFDKMCKAHFKAMKRMTTPIPKVENTDVPPPAQGFSVYDEILPQSLNFVQDEKTNDTRKLPLIVHLKEGFDNLKPPAWHRNEERRARGMFPIDNPAAQLEGWERELVWMEILVLTGVPGASFRHLARAWGRDKGFHMVLAQFICERHGDVERKKRHGEKNRKAGNNKKRRKTPQKKPVPVNANNKVEADSTYNNNEDVGADVWDPSLYGDVDTNEALAAEIFDFTEKEFERVVSKYKQGPPSDTDHSGSTDITAQAAMSAILGHSSHHRSNSMMSNASAEEILPVHAEETPQSYQQQQVPPMQQQQQQQTQMQAPPMQQLQQQQLQAPPMQQQMMQQQQEAQAQAPPMQQLHQQQILHQQQVQAPPIQHHQQMQAPPAHIQQPSHTYLPQQMQQHVLHHQQQQIQQPLQQHQQQVFQHPSQVQAPPIQHPVHAYPPQQQQQHALPQHQQQQQPQSQHGYNMHTPAPMPQQAPAQIQAAPQTITQQISTPTQTAPAQQMPQAGAHSQAYPQQAPYTMAPVPSAHTTQPPPQPQAPLIQQQQQQQQPYPLNLPTQPQHKEEPFNPPVQQHSAEVEYERQQLQKYETSTPMNLPPPQPPVPPQQMVPIPRQQPPPPQQQQQQIPIQYTQTNIVPEPATVGIAPQQHQLPYPPGSQQQPIHSTMLAHPQNNAAALAPASGQEMIHSTYPPQQPPPQQQVEQQQQGQLTHMMNHPAQPAEAQDPLEVHHEMNATREDPTNL